MKHESLLDRRAFLGKGSMVLASSLAGCTPSLLKTRGEKGEKEYKILPPEDLMREHGVLRRLLLIYEESIRRINTNEVMPVEPLAQTARIVRSFIEGYHEKLEEDSLFPRFRKAGRLVDLVSVLEAQHKAGRKITEDILRMATPKGLKDAEGRSVLAQSLYQFARMYRPHAAREDTVLFPALRGVTTPREFDALGEEFEKREEDLFGYTGFYRIVDQVADIEKKLGIYDLSKFTPATLPGDQTGASNL